MPKEAYYIDMMQQGWQNFVNPAKLSRLEERIRITSACRDCDDLPRHPEAGNCLVDESGHAVQVMHNGLKVLYGRYYGSWMNEIITRLDGVHEPQEERVFAEVLKHIPAGATMIEAGCYWGYYSMWFAREIERGQVFLVEPQPNQMKTAEDNFALNGLTGDFTLGYFGEYPEKKKEIQERRINHSLELFTLRKLMARKGLDHVNILHADIQGHEERLLKGARRELRARAIDWLFISTHGTKHAPSRKILTDEGYRIVAEHGIGQSASADGLLVAQNPDLPEIAPISISEVEGLVQAHS